MDDGRELGITISIGGCIFPVDAGDEEDLFRKADQAMYRAKKEGKNRVSFFGA
jgi:diguanylate cyclase (GGDEF)-like protein